MSNCGCGQTHLNQVEAEYREKLDKEIQAREAAVKVGRACTELKHMVVLRMK